MKNLIFICTLNLLLYGCGEENNGSELSTITWQGVFYDGTTNTDVHDPKYNYSLIIDELDNIKVIAPTESSNEKVIAVEILNESEMDVTWVINDEPHIVSTSYSYSGNNELVIDKFIYTEAAVTFPNNLISGKFVR